VGHSSSIARVISEQKEAYRVKNADGENLARITGKQKAPEHHIEGNPIIFGVAINQF
jgi:hypothetical protein